MLFLKCSESFRTAIFTITWKRLLLYSEPILLLFECYLLSHLIFPKVIIFGHTKNRSRQFYLIFSLVSYYQFYKISFVCLFSLLFLTFTYTFEHILFAKIYISTSLNLTIFRLLILSIFLDYKSKDLECSNAAKSSTSISQQSFINTDSLLKQLFLPMHSFHDLVNLKICLIHTSFRHVEKVYQAS